MEMNSVEGSKDSASFDRQNVSFKFTKITSKTLTGNRLKDDAHKKEKDYVLSVAKHEIKSTKPEKKDGPLIIPMIKKNNWRVEKNAKSEKGGNDDEAKLNELAVKELLKETSEENEKWENREFINVTIPLIMQNKIPEGYETDDKMDVSLRPEESKLEDYDQVPVDQYGLAMLRGMGWKEGDPIGANSKNAVQPIQVQLRPKGLGLGADTTAVKKGLEKNKDEKLALVKGAYVNIIQGPHRDHYGQVLGLDEENARAIIKLTGSEKPVTLPEFYIDVISKKVFDKESRVINRTSYETYQQQADFEEKNSKSSAKTDSKSYGRDGDDVMILKEEKSLNSGSPKHKKSSKDSQSKKRKHSRERSSEKHSPPRSSKPWIRPQLRVRLIDEKYKKGKYFNQKMVIVDVVSSKMCVCRSEDDRYLDDVPTSMLETVIPRNEDSYVMVVSGKYAGEVCTILKRDKSKCVATVQLLSDRDKALKVDYDSICEYLGDVSEFD